MAEYDGTSSQGKLPPALDKVVAARFSKGGDHLGREEMQACYGEYIPGNYLYILKLAKDGIIFRLPATNDGGCGDSTKLTFKELMPFLNPKGRLHTKVQTPQIDSPKTR